MILEKQVLEKVIRVPYDETYDEKKLKSG